MGMALACWEFVFPDRSCLLPLGWLCAQGVAGLLPVACAAGGSLYLNLIFAGAIHPACLHVGSVERDGSVVEARFNSEDMQDPNFVSVAQLVGKSRLKCRDLVTSIEVRRWFESSRRRAPRVVQAPVYLKQHPGRFGAPSGLLADSRSGGRR